VTLEYLTTYCNRSSGDRAIYSCAFAGYFIKPDTNENSVQDIPPQITEGPKEITASVFGADIL
jgi:hypothetical protein